MGLFDRIKSILQANQGADAPAKAQRTLSNMRVGDILTYDLMDYKVEGVTQYRQGGQIRTGYVLTDGANARYLIVEQKENVRAYLFETLDARMDNPDEINNEMTLDDVSYFEAARGQSSVRTQGRSAFTDYDPVYWWLHVADNGRAMLFEWQNGEMTIREGAPVKPYECQILAATE